MTSSGGQIISWYDYDPDIDGGGIPETVIFLRIGFIQYQKLLARETTPTTTTFEVSTGDLWFKNLKQVQIYHPVVSRIDNGAFRACIRCSVVEFLMKPPRDEGQEEGGEKNVFPSQLVSIGNDSFNGCMILKNIIGLEHAAESLQEIGGNAFQGCKSLVNVDFLESLTRLKSLGSCAFQYNVTLTTVDLSKAVHLTELQSNTFDGCKSLVLVHLPPNLLEIGHFSFFRCFRLEEIILPSKLQRIGKEAFTKCSKLKSIVLPSSLQQIGADAFKQCDKLMHVVLPAPRMPFLKKHPFNESCKSLSSLELSEPVPCHQWPLILEQFCKVDGIASADGGIQDPKNRNSIVWNFLCHNMPQLFMRG